MRLHEAGQDNHVPPINHFGSGGNEIGANGDNRSVTDMNVTER